MAEANLDEDVSQAQATAWVACTRTPKASIANVRRPSRFAAGTTSPERAFASSEESLLATPAGVTVALNATKVFFFKGPSLSPTRYVFTRLELRALSRIGR